MYSITKNGIIKKLETWNLIIPLHDNDHNYFSQSQIDKILENILLNYPGLTIVNCIGFWKDQKETFNDENYQIIIDTLPSNSDESNAFFTNLKSELAGLLRQEKIYITKTNNKEELLSFKEFFSEIGLEIDYLSNTDEDNLNLAQQIVSNPTFFLARLGYETLVLRRDRKNKKIIWERKICGIRLKSEFKDHLPDEISLIGADQIDSLGDAIFSDKQIAIIGDYEYQKYILEKISYRPLIEVKLDGISNETFFTDKLGKPISTKMFIEQFTMSVVSNYMVLREENYLSQEIKINVGKDGSMQIGESEVNGNNVLHCPATINEEAIQFEVGRCINDALILFENNKLDPIAILQAKAKNYFTQKRAVIRKIIRSKSKGKI